LESGVQTLRVLTHDHEIEFRVTTRHVRQGAHRPQVRIQIQRLTQADVDGSKTLADGRGDGTLQRHLVAHDGIEQLARQRLAEFFERLRARVMRFPVDINARGFDNSYDV